MSMHLTFQQIHLSLIFLLICLLGQQFCSVCRNGTLDEMTQKLFLLHVGSFYLELSGIGLAGELGRRLGPLAGLRGCEGPEDDGEVTRSSDLDSF
jgi:hypothetical protein